MPRLTTKSEADKAAKIIQRDFQMIQGTYEKVYLFLIKEDFEMVDKIEGALIRYIPGLASKFAKYSRRPLKESIDVYDKYTQEVRQEIYQQAKAYINNQKQTNESTETDTTASN